METNLFGALWVTQAALPFLRAQGSGHIIQVSSIGGISAFPRSGSTTRRSGRWRASARRWPRRSRLRRQGHADRAGRVRHRLGRPLGRHADAAAGVRRGPRGGRERGRARRGPRATRPRPGRRSSTSSTPTSRRCGSSSATRRWASPPPTTRRGWRPGGSGSRRGGRPGEPGLSTTDHAAPTRRPARGPPRSCCWCSRGGRPSRRSRSAWRAPRRSCSAACARCSAAR